MLRSAAIPLLLFTLTACGSEPLNQRVLVVYASNVPDSETVARYYARARHIPASNLCPVTPKDPQSPMLASEDYERTVKKPIEKCLASAGKDKILYIVLAYFRPFQVDPGGLHNYALDSYLADIWDVYASQPLAPIPHSMHPYYADNHARDNIFLPFVSLAGYRAKTGSPLIYSVWRLDGPTPDIARSLVDKAIQAESQHGPQGRACIDELVDPVASTEEGYRAGDWDLRRAAEFLSAAGFKVLEDNSQTEFGTPPSANCSGAALYSGWYSLMNYNDAFSWNVGAIGFHLDSLSAQDPREGKCWAANALKRGITVTSGAVSEPFLSGLPRPSGIFHDLLAGANVGDAFLRNTRFLKWKIVNIGDPLYTPFAGGIGAKKSR